MCSISCLNSSSLTLFFQFAKKDKRQNPIILNCVQWKFDTFSCSLVCSLIVCNTHPQKPCWASYQVNIPFFAWPSPTLPSPGHEPDSGSSVFRPQACRTNDAWMQSRSPLVGRHGQEEPSGMVCVRPPAAYANRSSLETFSTSSRLMDGGTLAFSFDGERSCLRRPGFLTSFKVTSGGGDALIKVKT